MAPEWQSYFGFDEPYDNQRDAIESALQVGRANGYLAMEGACGTGKTMAALTAAATLIREGEYDNAVVVTPVKQQRQQFVDDIRTMNAGRDDPLASIALVGKRDLCPYGREDVFPDDVGVHDRCEDLRENTAQLVDSDGGDSRSVASVAVGNEPDEIWWDPELGSKLAKAARPDSAGQQQLQHEMLSTAGATSPYQRSQPRAPEGMADGDEPLYCPFEADFYARNRGSPVDFTIGEESVVTAEEYLPAAVERGTCPHRVMGVLLEHAEIVVGNYNHLFDPDSRPLLEPVLNDRTFLIVDEAHRLEERVRDLLSGRVGRSTLLRARNDLNTVLQWANKTDEHRQSVRDELASHDVPLEAVADAHAFYADVIDWLDAFIERSLDTEAGNGGDGGNTGETATDWRVNPDSLPDRDLELPLRDPETVEQDELTGWAEQQGYTGKQWRSLPTVGAAVEATIDALGLTRTPVCAPVGVLFQRWWETDHASYLREVELEHAPKDERTVSEPWQAQYTAGLVLFECMPGETLSQVFNELGGGVLMSATLEPLDIFSEVAGLETLRQSRPVVERSYGLPFPEANRASWLVDATPFTARNRGNPEENSNPESWNRTRDEYGHILRTLGRSPGNVLIAMPNYREAAWAASYLESAVDKPVLLDQATANERTEELKQKFFAGGPKVLVTSTRGTLTEGVDYDGDKLHCCAVVGVPLVNIGSPRVKAVRRAYGDEFGEEHAFEYALTVPAVRRARQTIGRVIRGADEVGVRVFVGRRYIPDARHSVFEYLSAEEQSEFVRMTADFLDQQLSQFWRKQENYTGRRNN